MSETKRERVIAVRVTDSEFDEIVEASKAAGQAPAGYLRHAALTRARTGHAGALPGGVSPEELRVLLTVLERLGVKT